MNLVIWLIAHSKKIIALSIHSFRHTDAILSHYIILLVVICILATIFVFHTCIKFWYILHIFLHFSNENEKPKRNVREWAEGVTPPVVNGAGFECLHESATAGWAHCAVSHGIHSFVVDLSIWLVISQFSSLCSMILGIFNDPLSISFKISFSINSAVFQNWVTIINKTHLKHKHCESKQFYNQQCYNWYYA